MTSRPRDVRRHLRLRCQLLHAGAHEHVAYTSNISLSGAYVRVATTPDDLGVDVGEPIFLRILLNANERPADIQCIVRWLSPNDRDANGRPVVGVGLEFNHLTEEVRASIRQCVELFRHAVVLLDASQGDSTIERDLGEEFRILRCHTIGDALSVLDVHDTAVVMVDEEKVPPGSAAGFFAELSAALPRAAFARIVIGPGTSTQALHDMINVGVQQYLTRPIDTRLLSLAVRRAAEAYALGAENERLNTELERSNARLKRENAYLRQKLEGAASFDHIIGKSPALRQCLAELERIRDRDVTVHIHGETGTGKELVARGLHLGGPRSDQPFVAHNCAGMTESLLQSTLFGHERGAFTGADKARTGLFKEADRGTLFLDEVAELPTSVQGALLRVLQESEIVPVGSSRAVKVNVRVISATHKDLRAEVQQGRFREDLYFRLVVLSVSIPALRDRAGDISMLAQHFFDRSCERYGKNLKGFTPQCLLSLERYSWPGNVRELENEIERLVLLAQNDGEIGADLLSSHIRGERARPAKAESSAVDIPEGLSYDAAIDRAQRLLISRALQETNGVVAQAAKVLSIERTRLLKLVRRLGLQPEEFKH